jgi:hypothetical protein
MILHFNPTKNDKFNKPVAYTEKGVLAVIDSKSENAKKVQVGEDWECQPSSANKPEDAERFLIVIPVSIVRTKQENIELIKLKMLELKEKWENR